MANVNDDYKRKLDDKRKGYMVRLSRAELSRVKLSKRGMSFYETRVTLRLCITYVYDLS